MAISQNTLLIIALAPLVGAIVAGFFGRAIGRAGAHWITIAGVGLSCALSMQVLYQLVQQDALPFNQNLYTWFDIGGYSAHVGFLVDRLTAMMMVVVTFVSLLVHVYTIGYMADDPGYQRFFSYISLFTFAMLMLVMSNNFLQLFFGWEAVGLVSYLLIGFWFKKPTAIFANLKAFLVNRVGDFGFLLGIAGILYWFGTLDYATVFGNLAAIQGMTFSPWDGAAWSAATLICICLFIGAMGKSAQVPLHVWLPDSMEGPTPISALIHAATMVTAGIFMVARMSPLFELSQVALDFVLFIGATTALFTGLIGIIQNDIKRVVAYSTLSQLGYMTVALGVSAYSAAVFHLMTHAFFKALLFLAAGSVIIGMHHEQDMRRMGGLRKYMPITYVTCLIGTLALVGTPFFSGFYSKDTIIEAAGHVAHAGGGWVQQYAYWAVLLGVFITSFYSFRLLYLTFHGRERFRDAVHEQVPTSAHATGAVHDGEAQSSAEASHGAHADAHAAHGHATGAADPVHVNQDHAVHGHPGHAHADHTHVDHTHVDHAHVDHGHGPHEPHESPWVVTLPLILLAIPSMLIGFLTVGPMLDQGFFDGAIRVSEAHDAMRVWAEEFHGPVAFALHGMTTPTFWLAFAGFALATYIYLFNPGLADKAKRALSLPFRILDNKYGFDTLWIKGFAGGGVRLGRFAWRVGDAGAIDGVAVNGTALVVDRLSGMLRPIQSGYLYHYAFAMILGLIALLYVLIRASA